MKTYCKPEMKTLVAESRPELSSLSTWLSDNSLTDAGITTYLINS